MTSSTLTDRHRDVSPDALLSRATHNWISSLRPTGSTMAGRAARRMVHALMAQMTRDRMIVHDDLTALRLCESAIYGVDRGDLVAEVTVRDVRAYVALVTEGAIGLGRGYVEGWWDSADPVTAVRVIIRNIARIDDVRNRISRRTGWATDRIRAVRPRRGRAGNREDIAAHYDLGNDFFELFLDDTMTYSSGVFTSIDASLADASVHKYDLLLTKLGVARGHRLLEIGTGWGGLAMRAAERTGCHVTTTTISSEQLTEARRRVEVAGCADRVELLDLDWRDLTGSYDRIISIEMIEAVDWRDYDAYFATIERCMKPDGMAAIQAICLPDNRYDRAKNTEDFIRRFVFPNGCLASLGAISKSVSRATQMQIIGVEDFSAHYAETLQRWRRRFEDRIDDARALGLDERFCRLWRFYFAYCEAGFRERHCTVNQIVLAGRDWRGTIARH